jgi:GxxExxY protein
MNTNEREFKHREISKKIIGVFYDVYNELGHGFIESVYHKSMVIALNSAGLHVCSPVIIPVHFRGHPAGDFEGDILVGGNVLLELKAVRGLDSAHHAQLLNYLRATDIEIGLLLNFGVKPEFKRLVFDNQRKAERLALGVTNNSVRA